MFEDDPIRVNKVPYDGPVGFIAICKQIASDAQDAGMDRINEKKVETVIQYVFSVRCALSGMPHFVLTTIKGFGHWIPDAKSVKLRLQYYKELEEYNKAFSYRLWLNRAILKRTKEMYWKYREECQSEYYMKYSVWVKATGRKKLLDGKYRELNKLRDDFAKRRVTKYKYIKGKTRKKKKRRT